MDALDLSQAMMEKAQSKVEKAGLLDWVHFQQGNARELPYPDETFDVLYNGYMFDLIPIDGFLPILKEFGRVLKPGGKLVLVNMSKPNERKTLFETVYEKGLPVGPCRPVLMSPYVEATGFTEVLRHYRPGKGGIVSRLWGAEIVVGRKAGGS